MSRIGFSFWGIHDARNPAQTLDTPDGHRYGRSLFMEEILGRDHELYILQPMREVDPYLSAPMTRPFNIERRYSSSMSRAQWGRKRDGEHLFPDLDVIFMEWRWSTYKNDPDHPDFDPNRYEPDLDRQRELLDFYHGKIPIIIWDTDLKVTPEDEELYPEVILADPSFETNRLTRDRVSLPFWTDWAEMIPTQEPYPVYGYIGNNYERPDEFERYYFGTKQDTRIMGIQTTMYGNWLQRSPERESPTSMIGTHREVAFNHRMGWLDSMRLMNRFICTTHVSKPHYYEKGFMSPRYLEALAVNCPALVPTDFKLRTILGERWIVDRPADIVDRLRVLRNLTVEQRAEVVQEQRENLRKVGRFDVKQTIDFIESVV